MERPWTSTASALLQNMSARVNQGCVQGQGQLALTSGSSSEYSSSASTSSLFIDLSSTGLSARFSLVTSHPSTKTIHFFSDTARIKTQLSFFFVNGEVAVCDVDGLSVEDVRSDRFFALKPLFSFFVVDIYSFGCIISGSNTALLYNCLQIPIRELRRASIMLRKSKILPCKGRHQNGFCIRTLKGCIFQPSQRIDGTSLGTTDYHLSQIRLLAQKVHLLFDGLSRVELEDRDWGLLADPMDSGLCLAHDLQVPILAQEYNI